MPAASSEYHAGLLLSSRNKEICQYKTEIRNRKTAVRTAADRRMSKHQP